MDARYSMLCDDGTLIIVHNRGIIFSNGAYIRTAPRFNVPKGNHDWLGKSQFVGSVTAGPHPCTVTIRNFRVL